MTTRQQVTSWVENYVHAWTTADPADIESLFAQDAEYHEWPYDTHWLGRGEIVKGWLERQPWQKGGWTFDWAILMITGDTAAIRGTGVYEKLGTFENLWTVTFTPEGTCRLFRMWNNEV